MVGLGYFGRFHAKHHAQNPDCDLVAVCDADAGTAKRLAEEHGCEALTDHLALKGRVDAVSIAVPTTHHARVARDLMDAGIHVLIEKPVTETVAEAEELLELAAARGLVLQVGHIESFSSVFKVLRERVRAPLYLEATRVGPWRGGRATDVSVVLDLMIHDLDLVMSLVDAPVERVEGLGAPVLSGSEDMARARLTFANGAIADVTASRVAEAVDRRLRVFEDGVLHECDFAAHVLTRKSVGSEAEDPIAVERTEIPREDSLGNEIAEFVACVRDGTAPTVGGRRGAEALRVAQLVMEDARARLGRMSAQGRNSAA
ncbi:putative oxidoreductase, Gfo/Idh/MocA family [Lutibaculum baratangense AMV1]|uniref:Putative oxidoreductase, Gfo/Idh/MocA family n=1 Tax=Lutibaculum baratangense AMV1 TaxID=631454 RepID=V4RKH9_9HYPH|nr:putative oxidoreductase, Gfo/Idh/MocA family [Lutibaculum baratangense AMV1]